MKKILLPILTAGLALTIISTSETAHADDFTESDVIPQSKNSKATVTFEAPKNNVAPVDPENPLIPDDYNPGVDGESTGYNGPLSLDVVPHFNFGSELINSNQTILYAENKKPYIQVTDLRGPEGGWHVRAKLSEFNLGEESDKKTLKGASITLTDGEVIATVEKPSAEPTISNENKITLISGNPEMNIVSANGKTNDETAQGLGTWLVGWLTDHDKNEKVELTVPAFEASAGTHKATINWTLSEGPEVNDSIEDNKVATSEGPEVNNSIENNKVATDRY